MREASSSCITFFLSRVMTPLKKGGFFTAETQRAQSFLGGPRDDSSFNRDLREILLYLFSFSPRSPRLCG
jgi:hypothetical protein